MISPFTNITGLALAKLVAREQAVLHLRGLVAGGVAKEIALQRTAEFFRFSSSVSALRRWDRRYAANGFTGLVELKAGRVGRKPAKRKARR